MFNKKMDHNTFKLSYNEKELNLFDGQYLIGSSEKSDFMIDSEFMNSYHAVISVNDGTAFITDLHTTNGTYINGKRVKAQSIYHGDILKLGKTTLRFNASITEDVKNKEVKKVTAILDLPPVPSVSKVQSIREKSGFYVDGEYCDIKFEESDRYQSQDLLLSKTIFNNDSYVEEEQREYITLIDNEEVSTKGFNSIEVIFVSNGNILSYDTLGLKKIKNAKFSSELSEYIQFNDPKTKLVEVNKGVVTINCPKDFSSTDGEVITFSEDSTEIMLHKGVHQIFIRKAVGDFDVNTVPYFWRDRKELKKVASRFFVFFFPFLLLTLVDVPVPEKKKDIVVIFKKKKEVSKASSLASTDDNKDSEAKKETSKKISENKDNISNDKKSPKNEKRIAKKTNKKNNKKNKNSRKVAKSSNKKVKAAKRPSVNLAANFSKMLGSSQFKSKSFKDSASGSSGSLRGLSVAQGAGLKTVGGGSSVKGLGSSTKYGNGKGYKSNGRGKRGFDSSFTSTKTVVLGAIDPDILRRILREHIPQFRYCYQQELGRNSKIKGIIDLNFMINGKGRVSKTSVDSKRGKFSKKGINCVSGVLKMIKFPKPKGGGVVEVKQPLNFSSDKTKV